MTAHYLDFDLLIEPVGDLYRARLVNSPAGQARSEFALPFSREDLSRLVMEIRPRSAAAGRDVRRSREKPQIDPHGSARTFGSALFEAIFDDELLSAYRRSLDAARREDSGLRLRLRLLDAPQLADIPWEFLHDPIANRFLVLSVDTPVVRYLDLPEPEQPLDVELPVVLLAMISNPEEVPPLEVDLEWQRLNEALAGLEDDGLVVVKRMQAATLPELQAELRRGEVNILHFIGHGDYGGSREKGVLLLEDQDGQPRRVDGAHLGTLLHDHDALRLVTLNACHGARASLTDPFAGVAQELVRQGIPAVIAMQFEVSDAAAITFSHGLYSAVADGYAVDAALAEARKAMYGELEGVEWATPALYMRSPDGRIFTLKDSRRRRRAAGRRRDKERRRSAGVLKSLEPFDAQLGVIGQNLQAGRQILFIGADLPEELSGAPDRAALADALAAQAGIETGQRLAAIAQQVMQSGNRWTFTNALMQQLGTLSSEPGPAYRLVADLVGSSRCRLIVTTAYHRLLEQALGLPTSNVVSTDSGLAFTDPDQPVLIKLYGDIQQVESLVVTEQDQSALLSGRLKPDLAAEVGRAFRRNSVLFLGYDLSDPAVSALFDQIAGDRFQLPSYAIWSGLSDSEQRSYKTNRGLEVLPVDPLGVLDQLYSFVQEPGAQSA